MKIPEDHQRVKFVFSTISRNRLREINETPFPLPSSEHDKFDLVDDISEAAMMHVHVIMELVHYHLKLFVVSLRSLLEHSVIEFSVQLVVADKEARNVRPGEGFCEIFGGGASRVHTIVPE